MKKSLSILLSVCMLLSMCSIFLFSASAETTNEETPVTSSWDNGNILNVSNEFGGDNGGTNLDYYEDTDVFKYVYFYAGTHPSDTREATYYDMVKGAFWAGPEWYSAGTATDIDERKNTGHAAANVGPNFHYAPGVCFTAPLTGTVEFTYQYACLDNLNGANHSFVVVKGEVDFREASNCIISNTSLKTVGGYAETKSYDEVTFRVDVEAGDRIYFMVNGLGSNQGMNSHWISSAKYIEEAPELPSWDNGNILNVSNEFGGDNGGTNLDYYEDTDVFKYVYFYAGTHPSDTREATYYDMVKGAFWAGPEWYSAGTATDIDERKNTGHAAANVGPNFHYAPGVCFTAPLTGTVEFTYQYACLDNLNGANHSFVVVKGEVDFREASNCIISKTSTKTVGGYAETKSYDEVTFRVEVEAGDRIYFMVNALGSNQGMNSHWISSAKYVVESDATLLGHGLAATDTLDLRFLVQIADPSSTPTAEITVKTPLGDKTQTVNGEVYTGEKKDGGNYTAEDHVYTFTVELSAKQMTDEVVITVNDTSLTDTFTVESYCLGILELAKTDTSYTNASNTCATMLLYGYMAQINFNYRTDKLPKVDKELLSSLLGGIQ